MKRLIVLLLLSLALTGCTVKVHHYKERPVIKERVVYKTKVKHVPRYVYRTKTKVVYKYRPHPKPRHKKKIIYIYR